MFVETLSFKVAIMIELCFKLCVVFLDYFKAKSGSQSAIDGSKKIFPKYLTHEKVIDVMVKKVINVMVNIHYSTSNDDYLF